MCNLLISRTAWTLSERIVEWRGDYIYTGYATTTKDKMYSTGQEKLQNVTIL